MSVLVGTAGWSIGSAAADSFAEAGSAIERYATVFPVVEINSSFYRSHRFSTWERWRDLVPQDFRFSVKIPKSISHERKLVDCEELLTPFLEQVACLGEKLGILLLQLPPKLAFEAPIADCFFHKLVSASKSQVVCEPRHPSWLGAEADQLLGRHGVARVAADPERFPGAMTPGGWLGLHYYRLHGSPSMYRSSYRDRIGYLVERLSSEGREERPVWCVFDNTASSAAIPDALMLQNGLPGRA
ncbi:DUF72 domain-containing protein [Sphingomonas sp. LY29]|uniref:DUF72 domain-containing protein n=1 Tax=Sphingomonas sp. LY29 TaxID=3095341 RepID=UPI002D785A12|nr:DUF72 domain-containing protein [Sphingomonas sp. LY29]WRP26618.1 DUF72 domain-containing protein [Sphingomonas sp. LY29]